MGYDRVVLDGDPATRSFALIYLRDDCVIALDCVNATRAYVQGRKLIGQPYRATATASAGV